MILCIGTTPAAQRVMVFKRLSLDAVNRATTTLDGVAGKSINVAKVLKTLGETPVATGFVGGSRGGHIREALVARGIEAEFVIVASPTRQCITVIDQAAGTITELVEEAKAVEPDDFRHLIAFIEQRVNGCRAVVMSGTIAAGGQDSFYQHCTELARRSGAFSIVDAQGAPLTLALQANPDLVKPNRQELGRTVGRELCTEEDAIGAIRELQFRGAKRVVVTAGKQPTLAADGERFWRIRPPAITAVNPIGSGDAFTAALTWRLLRGDDLGEACRWGAAAGAANALSLMPGELESQDVERLSSQVQVESM
jgi:tagatose 6-phosphate kinase